ncbi:MAG: LytTR family DNA-binding domain-containing protein [Acidobacteria bacterium]|nr:LytTR family DNA-binding domain-containing protein [Acidobacteriota bacterium]
MRDNAQSPAKLTALIVDDEELARDELAFLLKSFPAVEVVGTAGDGLEALQLIVLKKPDIVFMDVQMPGLNGLEVVRELVGAGGEIPHFIFATAYDQYAVQAFEVNAVDYLLKPIEKDRLGVSIERARKLRAAPAQEKNQVESLLAQIKSGLRQPTKVLLNNSNRMFLVDAGDIIYASIQDGFITIVSTHIEGQSNYKTIEELQSNLDAATFWRPHRSYLVNINKIQEVVPWFKSSYQLRMSDKKRTEIPVSRAQTKRLRELFKL